MSSARPTSGKPPLPGLQSHYQESFGAPKPQAGRSATAPRPAPLRTPNGSPGSGNRPNRRTGSGEAPRPNEPQIFLLSPRLRTGPIPAGTRVPQLSPPPGTQTHPKMTAFQTMMLFSDGAPLTPAGGSSCNLQGNNTGTSRYPAPAASPTRCRPRPAPRPQPPAPRVPGGLPLEVPHETPPSRGGHVSSGVRGGAYTELSGPRGW